MGEATCGRNLEAITRKHRAHSLEGDSCPSPSCDFGVILVFAGLPRGPLPRFPTLKIVPSVSSYPPVLLTQSACPFFGLFVSM